MTTEPTTSIWQNTVTLSQRNQARERMQSLLSDFRIKSNFLEEAERHLFESANTIYEYEHNMNTLSSRVHSYVEYLVKKKEEEEEEKMTDMIIPTRLTSCKQR